MLPRFCENEVKNCVFCLVLGGERNFSSHFHGTWEAYFSPSLYLLVHLACSIQVALADDLICKASFCSMDKLLYCNVMVMCRCLAILPSKVVIVTRYRG